MLSDTDEENIGQKLLWEGGREVEAHLEADHENWVNSPIGDVTFHDTAAEH
jgi:hypothetical protein